MTVTHPTTALAPKPIVLPPLIWQPSPNYSSRHGTPISKLVYHETAGSYASAVSWLCNPKSEASSTIVLREDGNHATQLVKVADKAWTQAAYNPESIGIEHANITAKGYATEHQLQVSARIFAWLCWKYDIPVRIARKGIGPGICRHSDLGIAGGNHLQCGMGDKDFLRWFQMIEHELERGGFRKTWAR